MFCEIISSVAPNVAAQLHINQKNHSIDFKMVTLTAVPVLGAVTIIVSLGFFILLIIVIQISRKHNKKRQPMTDSHTIITNINPGKDHDNTSL